MADVITRFKLETSQFDSKLRDSSKRMSELVKQLSLAGDDFNKFAQSSVEQARALGKIESGATNLKDRLKDLVGAYNDVARQYNVLTEEQKNGEFGKALAESLKELQGRIKNTKDELYSMPGALDQLSSKFTINVDALKLLEWGLKAVKAALGVVKDAFFQSETSADEFERTIKGAESAYDMFLSTLNGGNWSNFFSNLSKAIQGGRDLADVLDRLGSVKANNQAAIAIAQAQLQQLRVLKQQGQDVDDQIKATTQRLKELQGQQVRAGKNAGRTEIVNTLRNEVAGRNTTGVQVTDSQLRAAANRALKEGQAYFDGMANLVRKYENDSRYQTKSPGVVQTGTIAGQSQTVTVSRFDLSKLSQQAQRQYLIAKALTEGESRVQQGISTFAQAVNEGAQSARDEFRGNRYAASGSGGGGGKSGTPAAEVFPEGSLKQLQQEMKGLQDAQALVTSPEEWQTYQTQIDEVSKRIDQLKGKVEDVELFPNLDVTSDALSPLDALKEKIATSLADAVAQVDETTISTLMRTVIANGIDGLDLDFSSLQEMMAEGLDIPDEKFQELQDKINEQLQAMGLDPINIDFKTGEIGKEVVKTANDTNKAWQAAANAISSAGSAMQNMEDPAAKVSGIVMQAIANIALGFAQAAASPATGAAGVFGWIAAATAGLATMTATIASIKNATKGGFASGGIVPGNSFSGDNLHTADYGINAGELILSRSQQYAVASQLEGVGMQGGSSQPYVNAETIFLGVNNYLRREGRGEIVTSKSR